MDGYTTLLLWLAKGTTVLLLAMTLSAALRRAPAGARYVVWLATFAVLLLVPPMSTWLPVSLPILPAGAVESVSGVTTPNAGTPASAGASAAIPTSAPTGDTAVRAASGARRDSGVPSPGKRVSARTAIVILWGAAASLLFAWLALGALKVRRIVRRARPLADAGWLSPMYDVSDRLDLAHAPRLVMSDEIEMPFACGLVHPTIVLPRVAEEWNVERRRVVLFHELAHIRRRDLLGHTIGRLTCALYWFHPLVWSAAKRLRAESERACDDLVLACGGARASDYASHLLEIVTQVRRYGAPATALPMADKREFEGRMLAILDPGARRAAPSRAQQLAVALGFGALALSTAAVAPRRAADERAPAVALSPAPVRSDAAYTSAAVVPQPRQHAQSTARRVGSAPVQVPAPAPQPAPAPVSLGSGAERSAIIARVQSSDQRAGADTALLGRILRTDRDPGVRKAAAWALQGRRDGMPLLLERLRVDADAGVREMSAWALAGMASEETASALAHALVNDASAEVRGTSAWALGHMSSRTHTDALTQALGDEAETVRHRALWALAHQRLDAAPKRVVDLLHDEESDVRLMAAWVLGEIGDRSTLAAVREAFKTERDHDVQEAEFRTLLLLGDRSQALIDLAMASDDPEIRARAVRLIAGHDMGPWPWPWPWPEPRPEP